MMGSGMGLPSFTLYAYELFHFFGVEAILRIGSAGGVAEDVKLRDLVLAMTASTNSHFADQYGFPGQLTPQASWELLRAAVDAAVQELVANGTYAKIAAKEEYADIVNNLIFLSESASEAEAAA